MGPPLYRSRLIAVALALAVVGAIAYFLFRSSGPEFGNVAELVSALEERGIECEDLSVSAPNPTPGIVDFGSCSIDGETVNLHVYENEDPVAEHIRDNVSVRGQNPNYFTSLVAGSNWVVDTYSEETSQQIEAAIGGDIH